MEIIPHRIRDSLAESLVIATFVFAIVVACLIIYTPYFIFFTIPESIYIAWKVSIKWLAKKWNQFSM